MPKWILFLWKLSQNSLATTANLFRRGIGHSDLCPICLLEEESFTHLFRFCHLAMEAWGTQPHIYTSSAPKHSVRYLAYVSTPPSHCY